MHTTIQRNYPLGTVLSVRVAFVDHFGIVTRHKLDGTPLVTSASRRTGAVLEEPLTTFANGQEVRRVRSQTRLSAQEVVRRARRLIGQKWDLFRYNCEHFVAHAEGRVRTSRQLQIAGVVALAFVAWGLLARRSA